MQLKYVDTKEEIIAVNKKSKHIEPHLHNALEIVCVTSGALELGVGLAMNLIPLSDELFKKSDHAALEHP